MAPSIRREGKQGDVPGPLDGLHQLPLMLGAGSRNAAGEDLATLGGESLQQADVLVVDVGNLLLAELAELFLAEEELLAELLFLRPIPVSRIHVGLSWSPRRGGFTPCRRVPPGFPPPTPPGPAAPPEDPCPGGRSYI